MIYITGDMHGDEDRLYDKQFKKLKSGDTLIICGDFGFIWDGGEREEKILSYLGSRKYNVCFLDGAHENFQLLSKYRQTVWKGGLVHRISGNLFHMCRGQIFRIENVKIFTFGGGESDDRDMRTEGESWFKEEMPSYAQMSDAIENMEERMQDFDIILTHEPPMLVKSAMLMKLGKPDEVNKLNGFLEEINRNVSFKQWYFGSMHEDRVITPGHTAVFEKFWPVSEKLLANVKPNIPRKTEETEETVTTQ